MLNQNFESLKEGRFSVLEWQTWNFLAHKMLPQEFPVQQIGVSGE